MKVKITRVGRTTTAEVEAEGVLGGEDSIGRGSSTCDPGDHYVAKIGESIAVGRALEDLGRQVATRWSARAITQAELDAKRQLKASRATPTSEAPRPPKTSTRYVDL